MPATARHNPATTAPNTHFSDPPQRAGFAARTGPLLLKRVCRAVRWVTLTLAACTAATPALPPGPMLHFPPQTGIPSQRPNGQIAQDFLDLEFNLESGQPLQVLSRFDGPVTVTLTGQIPPVTMAEASSLISRLRHEAGIDIRLTTGPANITVQFAAFSALQRIDPTAACFVAPNVSSLAEYRARRGTEAVSWQSMRRRERLAIFIPADTSPQEQRDCLHEELAQALGPLNDLYRLPDSVFNDNNFQSTLTGFDMLVLRLHYAPGLAAGMTKAQVATRLPALLARLNPGGQRPGLWSDPDTPHAWEQAAQTVLAPGSLNAARLPAAQIMLQIARAHGWQDARLGLAYFALGRVTGSAAAWQSAADVFATLPDQGVHLAHALLPLAALTPDPMAAIALADRALPLATLAQNAALIANFDLIKADALARLGQVDAARRLRLDSLAAARYGFGNAQDLQAGATQVRQGPAHRRK